MESFFTAHWQVAAVIISGLAGISAWLIRSDRSRLQSSVTSLSVEVRALVTTLNDSILNHEHRISTLEGMHKVGHDR